MSITIKDIAKMANVSTASVSRVLNNPEKVKADTRAVIEDIIKKNNFKPNALARGLLKNATNTIGVVIPDINNLFYPAVIRGIEDYFEQMNYNIFLCNTDIKIEKEIKYVNTLLEKRVDGILFLGTRPVDQSKSNHIKALSERIPVLIINDTILGSKVYSVVTDEIEGAYKIVKYLLELGHTRIAHITGDSEYSTYQNKKEGYLTALGEHHIKLGDDYIIKDVPYPEGGYRAAMKLLDMAGAPTAIFTASDQIAVGVIKAVFEKGYRIPEDISIAGYANIPMSGYLYPELTTVDQFPYETGRIAAETLYKLINGEKLMQKRIILEPQLLIRKSCGVPK